MDFLTRWIRILTERNFLSSPFPQCRSCLLYADDTLLFLRPTRTQILKTRLIFTIFGQLSGLKINFAKSELSVTSSPSFFTQSLAAEIQCKAASFPIKYLGLPLSEKRITRPYYLPLIDKIQARLTGWRESLLSVGGRIILVNAVLTAIPQFFMAVFLLPKWVVSKIDRIRRAFLWHGHKENRGGARGLYMVNWMLVTRPKSLGGLGVRDILITNKVLMAKWMWQWHISSTLWWKEATPVIDESHKPWNDSHGSIFWKAIAEIGSAFDCSTRFTIGNGKTVRFWEDNWFGMPFKLLYPLLYQIRNHRQQLSVNRYSEAVQWLLQLPMQSFDIQLQRDELLAHLLHFQTTQAPDEITWIRGENSFTVSSFYKFMAHTPSPTSPLKNLWTIKALLRVMIFAWLMLNNRLTTIDNLLMCQQNEESAAHLFQHCPFTK